MNYIDKLRVKINKKTHLVAVWSIAALPTTTLASPDPCSSCHSQPPSSTTYPNINRVHSSHSTLNVAIGALCTECHSGLGSGTLDHFLRAKNISLTGASSTQPNAVVFGGVLSKANGATPVFTLASLQCANTYCHGSTLSSNINAPQPELISPPVWNTPFPSGTHCKRCHGAPPANDAHSSLPGLTECINCHPHVNAAGDGFTDPTKHINGFIEANGAHAFPYGGSVHKPGGTGTLLAKQKVPYTSCSGCHDTTATGGTYPVASGVKPLCSACHLNMTNFLGATPGCWDCHGASATSGQPNATAFPNRDGRHNTHNSIMANCDFCHFGGGTGVTTHGNSNHVAKTVKDVKIAKNPARYTGADTITITQNLATGAVTCAGSCHIGSQTNSNHNNTW
jgi:predicted CxxxxCH...CXXCH cytochrome family protein